MKGVTFWNALWQGAARVQAEGFHPGLDASWDALEVEHNKICLYPELLLCLKKIFFRLKICEFYPRDEIYFFGSKWSFCRLTLNL